MATVVTVNGPRGRRYQVRYRNAEGQARRKHFARKGDADAFATTVEHAKLTGAYVEQRAGRQTFAAWWEEWWATTVNLRPSSRARDETYARVHILPTFGKTPLARITHADVRAWLAKLMLPKTEDGAGLAPSSAAKALQVFRKAMAGAVLARRLAHDPTVGVTPPKIERHDKTFLEPEEIATLAAAMDERYRPWVYVAAYCGPRIGETLALTRRRVDTFHRELEIAETLVEVRGHVYTNPPKTKAGRRRVPIPRFVCDVLDDHMSHLGRDDLVFAAPKGGLYRETLFRRRVFQPAAVAAGLGEWRRSNPAELTPRQRHYSPEGKIIGYTGLIPHALRDTAVSLWIASGATLEEMKAWAGHTSVVTLIDRYGHMMRRRDDTVIDRLDALARAAQPTKTADVIALWP